MTLKIQLGGKKDLCDYINNSLKRKVQIVVDRWFNWKEKKSESAVII